jgi:hypothetical protein
VGHAATARRRHGVSLPPPPSLPRYTFGIKSPI